MPLVLHTNTYELNPSIPLVLHVCNAMHAVCLQQKKAPKAAETATAACLLYSVHSTVL